jgi:hypothetical protein
VQTSDIKIDFSALVDIISNMGGMMIMFACMAVLMQHNKEGQQPQATTAKPIAFPMPYIPEKSSFTLCLRHGKCYKLPQEQLLKAVAEHSKTGKILETLDLTEGGVWGEIQLAPLFTGFRFSYRLLPDGGVPVKNVVELTRFLDETVARLPKDRFFISLRAWPEDFAALREVREYLLAMGYEVGWSPGFTDEGGIDIAYAIGDYDENLTSIKAQ